MIQSDTVDWASLPTNCVLSHRHQRGKCLPHPCAKCGSALMQSSPEGGARYYLRGEWLCADCNKKYFFQ